MPIKMSHSASLSVITNHYQYTHHHGARRLRAGAARSDLGRLRCPGLVAIRFVTGKVSTPFVDVTVVLVVAWRGRYARNDAK